MKCNKCNCEMIPSGRLYEDEMGFASEVNGKELFLPNVIGQPNVELCPKCGAVRFFHKAAVAERIEAQKLG